MTVRGQRYLTVHTAIEGADHVIWGMHGPHGSARGPFWHDVEAQVRDLQSEGHRTTIIGDLNVVDNPVYDRAKTTALLCEVKSYSDMLSSPTAVLADTWRQQHPAARAYTFLRDTAAGTQRSRIDAVLQDHATARESEGSETCDPKAPVLCERPLPNQNLPWGHGGAAKGAAETTPSTHNQPKELQKCGEARNLLQCHGPADSRMHTHKLERHKSSTVASSK